MRAAWDLATEEFGEPHHWPEWAEAAQEALSPNGAGENVIGDTLVSSDELASYQELVSAISALPERAWRLSFGEVVGMAEWPCIRRAARELYDALTPDLRRGLRLVSRSLAIEQVVASVFLDYADAKSFLLDELPANDPEQLMGYVLLVAEEVEGDASLVGSLRDLPDEDGKMRFPEVVRLDGWPHVVQVAQRLHRCLEH